MNDWRAVILDIVNCADLAHELLGVLGLDVPSVILIEVVQLVVDVNRGVDILFDHQGEFAVSSVYLVYSTVGIVLSVLDLLNLVTHNVKNDAQAQEHQAEDGEDNHRGTE